jgi:hypothetical protein
MKKHHRRKLLCAFLTALVLLILTSALCAQNRFRKTTDFDGDGKTDLAIFRNENGKMVWYVMQSTAGYRVFQWGLDTDLLAPGDYDGDGKTDFAVYRRAAGANSVFYHTFYIFQSSTDSLSTQTFTLSGDTPASPYPEDFDGDGKTDFAIILATTFNQTIVVDESLNHSLKVFALSYSRNGTRMGDLTGDGKADFFTSNNLYNVDITDYATRSVRTLHFGAWEDQFIRGDFDGDGVGDLTVFRASDGSWWTMKSSDGTVQVANWGRDGDIPVPGDYDGDGKTDLAIWRQGSPQCYYWIYGSQAGTMVAPFGVPNDLPLRY